MSKQIETGLVLHYCTLFKRVNIKTPPLKSMYFPLDSRIYDDRKRFDCFEKECKQCGKEYTSHSASSKFCSDNCKKGAWARICPYCGRKFTPTYRSGRAKACSISCGVKLKKARNVKAGVQRV